MPKASDLEPEGIFRGLFVGKSGSGKTGAIASFPGNVEIWDFDGRIRGLLGCPWVDRSKVSYESFPPKAPGMVKKLMDKVDSLINMSMMGQMHTQLIAVDSLTAETFAMLCQAKPLTAIEKEADKKGKRISGYRMTGPEEYSFEADTTYNLLASLRSIPGLNLIVTAHLIDRYDKEDADDPFSANVVVGEKLSVRDKIGENVQIYFDHVFKFEKKLEGNVDKHYVRFKGDLARTSFQLPNGRVDITGKQFYPEMMRLIGSK